MSRAFRTWLVKHGAAVLAPCQNELARFRAQDTLCIVYEPNRRGRQSFVPADLAREAYEAWQAGRALDLSNMPEHEPDRAPPDWRTVGKAGCALAARILAGEVIGLDEASADIGIHPDRMARIAAAHSLRIADGKITRAAA